MHTAEDQPIGPFELKATPVTSVPGIGVKTAAQLARLDIHNCLDLLLHLPCRWQVRTRYQPLDALHFQQEYLVLGKVAHSHVLPGGRRSWEVRILDEHGALTLRFFHYSEYQRNQVAVGDWIRCYGQVRMGFRGREMVHPEYRVSKSEMPPPPDECDAPVYRLTAGLTHKSLATFIRYLLGRCADDGWPMLALAAPFDIGTLQALCLLHQPPADASPEMRLAARNRLALEELCAHLIKSIGERKRLAAMPGIALPRGPGLGRSMIRSLGFRLTGAQARALKTILPELEREQSMLRLLQGDVGSGKTVVAAFSALRAAENGHQAAVMAPTELLAEQHFETLTRWLMPLGINVCLLTGSVSGSARAAALAEISSGRARIVVGTHALFQSDVEFDSLALVIIDEQHRFGVYQRLALKSKARQPHQLIMTATPIPRTLAMTMYAHMDHTLLDEMPPGRTRVSTTLLDQSRRQHLMHRVAEACRSRRQAYWVCTRIEESEEDDIQDVQNTAHALGEELGDIRVASLHGRMSAADKQVLMEQFRAGEIQVLVATTVIEVGVDVPNASLMVIENPERLGLAQLHQLRGRVGRGAVHSHCVLLHGDEISPLALERLQALVHTNDGFLLAEKDLELRGEGEITGTRQSGLAPYRIADLRRDKSLLAPALETARRFIRQDEARAVLLERLWVREASNVATV